MPALHSWRTCFETSEEKRKEFKLETQFVFADYGQVLDVANIFILQDVCIKAVALNIL